MIQIPIMIKPAVKNWIIAVVTIVIPVLGWTQSENPMNYQRWNIFDINNIRTQFNNTGMLADGNNQNVNIARPPAFEYPSGSGLSYGTCLGVVVGAPADQPDGAWSGSNPENLAFGDGTMDEGPADFWDEEHFAPYSEFVGGNRALMSDDPEAWPSSWPSTYPDIGDALQVGTDGFPGYGPNGELIAEQESFSVMYGWVGTDHYNQSTGDPPRYLNVQLINRGLAWSGSLYENFIVWVYVVRNMGTAPIHDARMAVHLDLGFMPAFLTRNQYDADRHYYDPALQLAYGWDDNGSEASPFGGSLSADEIAWGGAVMLEMPGASEQVEIYDASHFWEGQTTNSGSGAAPEMYYKFNLTNSNDPHDSDGDGIDDDFDGDGVPDSQNGGPGYYVGSGADGLQIIGSGAFDLAPGEGDTLIFATVFGKNEDEIKKNAMNARNLYESDWEVVTAPPAPIVSAKPGNRNVKLAWSTSSEKDPQFEGYKIYRSTDGGVTWGSQTFKDFDGAVHYIPLAQFDLENDVSGNYNTLPEYAWFDLGDNSGLPQTTVLTAAEADSFPHFSAGDTVRMFTDRNVVNGLQYQYYVASYDSGNSIIGPLENTQAKQLSEANNAIRVIPQAPTSKQALANVRVVPNPYVAANAFEIGRDREIQFTHLPNNGTVHIFNSAGERVRTLQHSQSSSLTPSILQWDLKNFDDQFVAPGVYFYYLTSDVGETRGKFVIIY